MFLCNTASAYLEFDRMPRVRSAVGRIPGAAAID